MGCRRTLGGPGALPLEGVAWACPFPSVLVATAALFLGTRARRRSHPRPGKGSRFLPTPLRWVPPAPQICPSSLPSPFTVGTIHPFYRRETEAQTTRSRWQSQQPRGPGFCPLAPRTSGGGEEAADWAAPRIHRCRGAECPTPACLQASVLILGLPLLPPRGPRSRTPSSSVITRAMWAPEQAGVRGPCRGGEPGASRLGAQGLPSVAEADPGPALLWGQAGRKVGASPRLGFVVSEGRGCVLAGQSASSQTQGPPEPGVCGRPAASLACPPQLPRLPLWPRRFEEARAIGAGTIVEPHEGQRAGGLSGAPFLRVF